MEDLVSKKVRRAFADHLSSYSTLSRIAGYFSDEGFEPGEPGGESGQRRELTYQYYSKINWQDPLEVTKVLKVLDSILEDSGAYLTWEWLTPEIESGRTLMRLLEKDGVVIDRKNGLRLPNEVLNRMRITGESVLKASTVLNQRVLSRHIKQIEASVESDPDQAIGAAKELLETTCKGILDARAVAYSNSEDLPALVKLTAKNLELTPDDIPDAQKGAEVIKVLLSNLTAISNQSAQLRNLYGSGHGRGIRHTGLQARHARLAVGAAATLATFLIETHDYQKR